MKILFFGDINGRIGRKAITSLLPSLIKEFEADFVIANGENAANNGRGITEHEYHELLDAGVDVVTLGNHFKGKRQIEDYIDDCENLIRPLNVLNFDKGSGSAVFEVGDFAIRVTNILGSAFMKEPVSAPAIKFIELLQEEEFIPIHIVDYHAESTAEKKAFAYYFDGKVSAVIGTHTHVQTNDAVILPKGCGFLSDVGMCGAYDAIIGSNPDVTVKKTILGENIYFELPEEGRKMVNFVVMEIDDYSGKCLKMKPMCYIEGRYFDGEASI